MGIALSALSAFQQALSPLHQWLDSLLGAPSRPAPSVPAARAMPTAAAAAAPMPRPACLRMDARATARPRQALRVVRVVDRSNGCVSRAGGRLVISGRLADVCAELDRLAAAEAAVSLRH